MSYNLKINQQFSFYKIGNQFSSQQPRLQYKQMIATFDMSEETPPDGWSIKSSAEGHGAINHVRLCEERHFQEALKRRNPDLKLIKLSIGQWLLRKLRQNVRLCSCVYSFYKMLCFHLPVCNLHVFQRSIVKPTAVNESDYELRTRACPCSQSYTAFSIW